MASDEAASRWRGGRVRRAWRGERGAALPKVPPISDSGRLPGGQGPLHHWRHGSLSGAGPIVASPSVPVHSMARAGNRKTIRTASAPGPSKLQRWLDVLAALLSHRYPIALDRLRREVPAYQRAGNEATFNRMFERDKDEMRAFGIPIETVQSGDPPEAAYQLRAADFYLPFMELAAAGGSARRPTTRRAPFTALQTLTFSPDELSLI